MDGTRQVTRQLDILRTLFARRFGVTVLVPEKLRKAVMEDLEIARGQYEEG